MPKPLVFMMGRSPAFLPVDRQYVRSHYWAFRTEAGCRLGFSAYAVKLLGVAPLVLVSSSPTCGEGEAGAFTVIVVPAPLT